MGHASRPKVTRAVIPRTGAAPGLGLSCVVGGRRSAVPAVAPFVPSVSKKPSMETLLGSESPPKSSFLSAVRGVVRGLDPRGRLLGALFCALVIVGLESPVALSLALILALCLLIGAGLPIGRTLKRMAMMDGFIVAMLVLIPFTIPGDAAFSLFGWPASWQGLDRALVIGLRANGVILCLMALVGSMEPTTLGHGLARLGLPDTLVHLLLLSVRYIDVINAEYGRLRRAMKTRGFRLANSRHTYRTLGYLIGMLLVRALDRSERIARAMTCRGFTGRLPLLDTLAWSWRDGLFALLLIAALGGIVVVEIGHGRLA
ncbi:Cobalt transport protein [Rhodospirillum rubrum ATCC 11170]|uniref:Cobalt transport protein n=2 Tax=Rhodospirillum rubrum TaxID=1085 RepID=Q2RR14_RHORT|nr:Cobalt transport protein [Rhodospirillum rubrum ATCC 11170]MBK5955101.1 cobalt ECF transporter T component CbiQ [Rhodospirillum rubrum]HAP98594.1 cobalt ECF transporter T component CbiQ [Rhodospirillum rubrum]HCF17879.1 cobalt ECF transporter T component CbiQ [Rhodospirillum rubrum]